MLLSKLGMSKVRPGGHWFWSTALDQILTGPRGLICKMNRIWPAASIVVKCAPTYIHPTTCGPPGENFGHPWSRLILDLWKYFLVFLLYGPFSQCVLYYYMVSNDITYQINQTNASCYIQGHLQSKDSLYITANHWWIQQITQLNQNTISIGGKCNCIVGKVDGSCFLLQVALNWMNTESGSTRRNKESTRWTEHEKNDIIQPLFGWKQKNLPL